MTFLINSITILKGCLLILASTVVAACQSSLLMYQGKTAEQENIVVLQQDSPQKNIWYSNDLTIYYEYKRHENDLKISGKVDLNEYLLQSFNSLIFLYVRANFIDTNRTILDSKLLVSAGYRQSIRTWKFNTQFKLPPGTTALVFSYRGKAQEGSDRIGFREGGGVTWHFWKNP